MRFVDFFLTFYFVCLQTKHEIRRLFLELDQLKEKTVRNGNNQFAAQIDAMIQAGRQTTTMVSNDQNLQENATNAIENGPLNGKATCEGDLRQRKNLTSTRGKSPKNSPDSGKSDDIFFQYSNLSTR